MRHGELNALRWDDIDFEEGCLQVQRTVGRIGKKGFVERAPKTRKSKREVVLPALALESLVAHRVRQQKLRERAGEYWKDQNLVFCNPHGGFLSDQSTRMTFHRLLKKAGLPQIRVHDLRHTASTLFSLEMEQPEKLVQELLGHENIEMTRGKYTHANRKLKRKMMEEVDRIFRGFL
jgi:integrase